jgi:hypothetical protein
MSDVIQEVNTLVQHMVVASQVRYTAADCKALLKELPYQERIKLKNNI